jgi:hypothetical protein
MSAAMCNGGVSSAHEGPGRKAGERAYLHTGGRWYDLSRWIGIELVSPRPDTYTIWSVFVSTLIIWFKIICPNLPCSLLCYPPHGSSNFSCFLYHCANICYVIHLAIVQFILVPISWNSELFWPINWMVRSVPWPTYIMVERYFHKGWARAQQGLHKCCWRWRQGADEI